MNLLADSWIEFAPRLFQGAFANTYVSLTDTVERPEVKQVIGHLPTLRMKDGGLTPDQRVMQLQNPLHQRLQTHAHRLLRKSVKIVQM